MLRGPGSDLVSALTDTLSGKSKVKTTSEVTAGGSAIATVAIIGGSIIVAAWLLGRNRKPRKRLGRRT